MIRIVTDSTSMLPTTLRDRYVVDVVPMTITIDDVEYHEGHDLTTADFYDRLATGATVTTAAPSPGAFLDAYRRAAASGAREVLSIHTGSNFSAVVSAATVAAALAQTPVTIVDTELVSFPVTLCIWAAGEAIARGDAVGDAAASARFVASSTGSVFVVGVPELARRGGRFVGVTGPLAATSIIELDANGMRQIDRVDDVEAALDSMVRHTIALARERPLRIGVGDARRQNMGDELASRLQGVPGIAEVVRYDVGPSVGAHTGAGSVGVVYAPAAV
jgi:DegV family protein with EDD domain